MSKHIWNKSKLQSFPIQVICPTPIHSISHPNPYPSSNPCPIPVQLKIQILIQFNWNTDPNWKLISFQSQIPNQFHKKSIAIFSPISKFPKKSNPISNPFQIKLWNSIHIQSNSNTLRKSKTNWNPNQTQIQTKPKFKFNPNYYYNKLGRRY